MMHYERKTRGNSVLGGRGGAKSTNQKVDVISPFCVFRENARPFKLRKYNEEMPEIPEMEMLGLRDV